MGSWNTASAFLIWCRAIELLFIPFRSFAVWLVFRAVGAPTVCTVLYRTKLLLAATIFRQQSMIVASSKHRPEPRPPTPRPSLLRS